MGRGLRERAVRPDAVRRRLRALLRAQRGLPADAAQVQDGVHARPTRTSRSPASTTAASSRAIKDGRRGFEIRIGGGTSIMPRVAPTLYEFVGADDGEYLKVTEAVLRIFNRQDELRANRARARIKVLVDRIGMDAFRELVEEELRGDWVAERDFDPAPLLFDRRRGGRRSGAARRSTPRPTATRASSSASSPHNTQRPAPGRLRHGRGEGSARRPDARAVPRARRRSCASYSGGYARTTVQQNLVLRWVRDGVALRGLARAERARARPASGRARSPTSSAARAPTAASSASRARWGSTRRSRERIESLAIEDPLTRQINIKMSGCPNGCGQHHIANIGFTGASIKVGERTVPAYIPLIWRATSRAARSRSGSG